MFGSRRRIEVKRPDQLRAMRRAGLVVARALSAVAAELRPGITTAELDAVAAQVIASAGAQPSFLDYGAVDGHGGFAGVTCLSVNSEVVHGVPGDRVLAEGDLISVDCGAIVDGWHGDAARTLPVGSITPEAAELSRVTREAMWAGIAAVRSGRQIGDVSAAVEALVAGRYGIVEEYVGHGIGSAMHQAPDVPNLGRAGRGPRITVGMALAIEPMLTAGSPANTLLDDGWTVVTDDGSLAAHWEHTVAVTEHGLWVLTAEDGGEQRLAELGAPFGPLAD
ncbi:methionyl aminopeptidase [Friedmanniella endophytica]|uniref:Methionine aminopeptidase n=1 Tax=Microlunatus kandeliicorticis TaxID=1759536 RepID=A0A7W3IQ01_9ACTN|nr:type I methionyl aminopeptidase [Microlunatus kandeliicorticis]MBA8793117.1 methionyl aminopeptidase [Microlunatus kandeliicorticis]